MHKDLFLDNGKMFQPSNKDMTANYITPTPIKKHSIQHYSHDNKKNNSSNSLSIVLKTCNN
jgi:hypothetical protein